MRVFDYIYHENKTCGARYDCGLPGVVLAYDEFSPECATWFCKNCWEYFSVIPFLAIAEDRRPVMIESQAQL